MTAKSLSVSTLKEAIEEDGLHSKKRSVGALERDELRRAPWGVMVASEIEAWRFVFVDEMGVNTSLSPVYGWSRKGERARWSVPRNRGPNTTLLSSMTTEGIGPSLALECSTNTAVFRGLCRALPRPEPGEWAGGGDGQLGRPQEREGEGVDRGAGM